MVKKIKYNEEELLKLSKELQSEMIKLKNSLNKLETNVAVLQTGDKNGAFWNGENAYEFYKASLGHIDHDRNLLKHIEKCSISLEEMVK